MSSSMASEPSSYRVRIAPESDGGRRIPDLSPREAVERWLAKVRVDRSDSTVSTYHYRLKHFFEWAEREGITEISDVTGWDLESFETHRREQDLEPISIHNELDTLQIFLKYCARVELVEEGLPGKVNPPTVPSSEQVDETRLKADSAQALLEYYDSHPDRRASRGHVHFSLAWYTGARLAALRGLNVEDYNPEEQCVEFVHRPKEDAPLKNDHGGERIVGLPEKTCEVVDEYLRSNRLDKYDDYGRQPLLTSEQGRPSDSAGRQWMYLATLPCLHSACPHGNDPETCDYIDYSTASKCPSSRSPHQVRTGSATWQLNRGLPPERVSERVNTSIEELLRHYDQPDKMEEMRERRREYLSQLDFEGEEEDGK